MPFTTSTQIPSLASRFHKVDMLGSWFYFISPLRHLRLFSASSSWAATAAWYGLLCGDARFRDYSMALRSLRFSDLFLMRFQHAAAKSGIAQLHCRMASTPWYWHAWFHTPYASLYAFELIYWPLLIYITFTGPAYFASAFMTRWPTLSPISMLSPFPQR